MDCVPQIEGIERFYGSSVHHCPYCDGWEHRDARIAVYGRGSSVYLFARELLTWSRSLMIVSDGPSELSEQQRRDLAHLSIRVYEEQVRQLEGTDGKLERVVFADGGDVPCEAMFFCNAPEQR